MQIPARDKAGRLRFEPQPKLLLGSLKSRAVLLVVALATSIAHK